MENPNSSEGHGNTIPRTQMMHFMIMFAGDNLVRFTRFINQHVGNEGKEYGIIEIAQMVGIVHGAYDTMQVVTERENSLINDVINRMTIPGEEFPGPETGQYL